MQRSRIPYYFLALAAVLAIAAVVLLILRPGVHPPPPVPPGTPPPAPAASVVPAVDKAIAALEAAAQPDPEPDPETALGEIGVSLAAGNPEELVAKFAKAIEEGDIAMLGQMMGDAAHPDTLAQLEALAALPMRRIDRVREVGELELNTRSRWALRLEGAEPGRDSISLDLRREDGKWRIEKIMLPPSDGEAIPAVADPLDVADAFIQALLVQEFEFARTLVDASAVSDAKIAGMCILFEEGGYRMRPAKPLRTMFQRDDTVGFLASVETLDGRTSAQFSLTMRRSSNDANWLVSEINLDQMLADYSRRMADGDIYYSPLVKNPAGGDTLALYFAFDEAEMNPRTRRQLEIVSLILKSDPGKRITLSGHTDALGTDDYNRLLSARRAEVVRNFLTESGVDASQIITMAKGSSQPRRPNFTEGGDDNPEGRRANRRTEIYLDF